MNQRETVEEFEHALAARLGRDHVVSVTYARLGLRLLLEALGVRAGDEVVLSGLTCRVVVLALQSAGFRPVYADLAPGALHIDADSVQRRLTPRTRAILFQHTFGVTAGLDAVLDLARQRGIPLIEDCAHCLPPTSSAKGVGTRGLASIWSHNFRKPMPVGAGGCVAISDSDLAQRIRTARNAGPTRSPAAELSWQLTRVAYGALLRPSTYWPLWTLNRNLRGDHQQKSLKEAIDQEVTRLPVRISARQAAWGLRALRDADHRVHHANELSRTYHAALEGLATIRQVPGVMNSPLYYYPVLASNKPALLEAARRRRLELIAWPLTTPIYPIERTVELEQSEYVPGSCPNAEETANALCGLPVDLMATRKSAERLIGLLREFEAGGNR